MLNGLKTEYHLDMVDVLMVRDGRGQSGLAIFTGQQLTVRSTSHSWALI